MAANLTTYDGIKTEVKALYNELLTTTQDNVFYKETLTQTQTALDNLSISDEKKAGLLIEFYAQVTNNTIARTFEQSLMILDKSSKLNDEIALLKQQKTSLVNEDAIKTAQSAKDLLVKDKEIAYRTQQITSMTNEDTRANAINAKDVVLKQAQYDLAITEKSIKEYQLTYILPEEKANTIKDGTIKTNQAGLITRQTNAYNDNLRVEEAKCLKDVIFAYAIGGVVPSSTLQTEMLNAVDAISI